MAGVQVNHKLGGRNCKIKGLGLMPRINAQGAPVAPPMWNNRPTMLIGIDVAHPQSFDKRDPSIAGIVASMDACAPRCPRCYYHLLYYHLVKLPIVTASDLLSFFFCEFK